MITESNFEMTNTIEQMAKDTIQVYVRVRPLNRQEQAEGNSKLIDIQQNRILLKREEENSSKVYTYDSVYDEETSQEEVFKKIGQNLIENFLNGYNCSIFAYGQTGAGKTYTMMGDLDKDQLIGLQPRCIEYLFYLLAEKESPQTLLKITYVEIYNEKIIDLLSDDLRTLNIREDLKKGVFLENVVEEIVSNFSEVMEVFRKGLKNRHVSETMMNEQSSRSHSIFTINFQTCLKKNDCSSYKNSMFNFIDLAGSERQRLTKTTGDRFKEGCNINKSLTVLGSVINSLAEKSNGKKKNHIRYRDSKLTFLLKNSLGGNSKTAFIANVSPASSYFLETLSTLMFANRAKMIKNDAKINENFKSKSLEALRKELLKTREELNLTKEKYDLLEKTQYIPKTCLSENCMKCEDLKKKSEMKILQMETILKESLIILRKSMVKWENQLESNFDSEKGEVIDLLKENSKTIKQLVLLLDIDGMRRECFLTQNEVEKENCIISQCKAEIKYHQEQNLNLEKDIKRLMEDFEKVEKILKNEFNSKNLCYEKLKSSHIDFSEKAIFNSLEIINKENKLKIDNLNLELEKLKTELRIKKEEENKYKNEISVYYERNKMLKSWNEQTLQDKKILNETIEKIRYEKFNLMKKFDEEFEMTKKKNEKLLEDIEYLEREKNILQEAYSNQNYELNKIKKNFNFLSNEKNNLDLKNQELIETNQKFENEKTILINSLKDLQMQFDLNFENEAKLKNLLEETKINFENYKNQNTKILENQLAIIQNFESENLKLKNNVENVLTQNLDFEIKNLNLEESQKKIIENLNEYIKKFEKSQNSKNKLVKTMNCLKTQSKHFFNSLLNIKSKLNEETFSIFDDFMVISQIKQEKIDLEEKLNLKEIENKNLKRHINKVIHETMINTEKIKNFIQNSQSHKKYFLKELQSKNNEISFLKNIYTNDRQKSSENVTNFINNEDNVDYEQLILIEKNKSLEHQENEDRFDTLIQNLIKESYEKKQIEEEFKEEILENKENIFKMDFEDHFLKDKKNFESAVKNEENINKLFFSELDSNLENPISKKIKFN